MADGYMFSWVRRGRIGADDWMPPEIPLGEETESYQIEVAPAGGTVVRSATVTSAAWHYPTAAMAADLPALPVSIDLTVRQLSASVGWGLTGTAGFTLA